MDERAGAPLGTFIALLIERLSYADPSLSTLSAGLRAVDVMGDMQGQARGWTLGAIFSQQVVRDLPRQIVQGGSGVWGSKFY